MGINVDQAERQTITIKGVELDVPAPFVEGHRLRLNEAKVLNQTYAENVRNNFSKDVMKAKEEAGEGGAIDTAALQKQLDAYVETYDFGERRGGGGVRLNPVDKEALDLARKVVQKAIKKKNGGTIPAEMTAAQITELARQFVEKNPAIREKAKIIVEARSASIEDFIE